MLTTEPCQHMLTIPGMDARLLGPDGRPR
jgi:hypothetical protein